MAFYVVSKLFSSVPALFRVLQGNERFAPLLDGLSRRDHKGMDNGAFHVATAIGAVIEDLKNLTEADSPVRAAIMADAVDVCKRRIQSAVDKARENNEPLLPKKNKAERVFLEEDIEEYMEGATLALDNAKARVERAILDGCKAFKACAGMDKLREALGDLQRKRRYALNADDCPPAPKFGAVPGAGAGAAAGGGGGAAAAGAGAAIEAARPVLEFFGVPEKDWDISLAMRLGAQWEAHRALYKPPPSGYIVPPAATMTYWMNIKAHAPDLSKYACLCLLRPNGNAAPERTMSLLTAMDKPTARSTKAKTLKQVLFLRGNAEIVRMLLHEGAIERVSSTERLLAGYAGHAGGGGGGGRAGERRLRSTWRPSSGLRAFRQPVIAAGWRSGRCLAYDEA
jgi:hypothetical protein